MRTHYRNGEAIGLQSCGCDGCSPSMIQGLLCHETGCPYAWKDHKVECKECGLDFYPERRGQTHCEDCTRSASDGDDEQTGSDEETDLKVAIFDSGGHCIERFQADVNEIVARIRAHLIKHGDTSGRIEYAPLDQE